MNFADLEGKTCLITGAGKGFGRNMADGFFAAGCQLALVTRSKEDIATLQREFKDTERVVIIEGDVSDSETVDNIFETTMEAFGRLDILINNAGMRFRKPFLEIKESEFRKVMDNNLMSIMFLCKTFIPVMLKNKYGKIVNISSVAGTRGLPHLSAYVASKSAVNGLTKSLALEFAESGLNINAIAAGFCKTSYFEDFKKNKDLYEFTLKRTPIGRWGNPEDITNACLYLASDASGFVTGEILNVDGGWSAW
jgi:NAD(P)-dependent dehydrogenase (short-subunit alcohol dehydrogenase family)